MKVIKSFQYAFNGIKATFLSELNFKIHLIFTLVVIVSGAYFQIPLPQWLAIILCIGMVLSFELVNTAMEKLCDSLHPEIHPTIKMIKDITAAAVFIVAIISVIVAMLIFLPHFLSLKIFK